MTGEGPSVDLSKLSREELEKRIQILELEKRSEKRKANHFRAALESMNERLSNVESIAAMNKNASNSNAMKIEGSEKFTGRFPKYIEGQTKLGSYIEIICGQAMAKVDCYSDISILNAIQAALPLQVLESIAGENISSVQHLVTILRSKFNNPQNISAMLLEVKTFKFDLEISIAANCGKLLHLMDAYNRRCHAAGLPQKAWVLDRAMDYLFGKIAKVNQAVAEMVFNKWHELEDQNPEAIQRMRIEDIERAVARAEEVITFRNQCLGISEKGNTALATQGKTQSSMYSWTHWACGKTHQVKRGTKAYCPCGIVATCSKKLDNGQVCCGNHKDEYHDTALRSLKRQTESNSGGNWRLPNTQGGNKSAAIADVVDRSIPSPSQDTEDHDWVAAPVNVQGHIYPIVIDCAAQFSSMSLKTFETIPGYQEFQRWQSREAYGASGGSMEPAFQVIIPLLFDDRCLIKAKFRICRNSTAPILFGLNGLRNSLIDLEKMFFTMGQFEIKLFEYNDLLRKLGNNEWVQSDSLVLCVASAEEGPVEVIDIKEDESTAKSTLAELKQDLIKFEEIQLIAAESEPEKQEIIARNNRLWTVVEKWPGLFKKVFKAGQLKVSPVEFEFNRDINQVKPIVMKLKDLSFKEMSIVDDWVRDSLRESIVEESQSTWRHTIFPVRKPDRINAQGLPEEDYRIVTPFFGLNKLLNLNGTGLPKLQDIQIAVANSTLFSALDMRQAFFQIPLAPESRPYTAFSAPGQKLLQYTCVPMGCNIATGLMQTVLSRLLGDMYYKNVLCYADDIIIYSKKDLRDHMSIVDEVCKRLWKANANLKKEKAIIGVERIKFLGMMLSGKGWEVSPDYVSAVKDADEPDSYKSLKSFLGLCSWQRRFISHYAEKAFPLTKLFKKGTQGRAFNNNWGDEQQKAFLELKAAMSSTPVLCHPNFERDFHLFSDASGVALGGVLSQEDQEEPGSFRVLGYFSRKLNNREAAKGIPERELMGLMEALEHFRSMIFGFNIHCKVDQRSLEWLINNTSLTKYMKYSARLQEYSIIVKYLPGASNKSDWCSRHAATSRQGIYLLSDSEHRGLFSLNSSNSSSPEEAISSNILKEIVESIAVTSKLQQHADLEGSVQQNMKQDPFFAAFLSATEKRFSFGRAIFNRDHFRETQGIFFYREKIIVPQEAAESLIHRVHCISPLTKHLGRANTLRLIMSSFYWPSMSSQIQNFIDSCIICQKAKFFRGVERPMSLLPMQERRFGLIALDIYGGQALPNSHGYTSILTIIDHLTSYVKFVALKNRSSNTIVEQLWQNWASTWGWPFWIHTDNAQELQAGLQKALQEERGIKKSYCGVYAAHQNGRVERAHRFLGEQLRIYSLETGSLRYWHKELTNISARHNLCYNPRVKSTPSKLVLGYDLSEGSEEVRGLPVEQNMERYMKKMDEAAREFRKYDAYQEDVALIQDTSFNPGDLVFVQCKEAKKSKFNLNQGPYEVREVLGSNSYRVWDTMQDKIVIMDGKNLRRCFSTTGET